MNYLIQAYACSPYKGGEYAVSWGWISHLDKLLKDDDRIYVTSLTLTQQNIIDFGLKHVEIISIDGLDIFRFLNYNSIFYHIWQSKAYKAVLNLQTNIDVLHIYSLSDFRRPGKWHKMKKAFKILGPVGGGQVCPKSLRCYDDKSAIVRNIINIFCRYNPFYQHKVNQYSQIYACNLDTFHILKKSKFLIDVPLNDKFKGLQIEKDMETIPTILFVGRLINKKGILFFLDVLDQIDDNIQYKAVIYGDGIQKQTIIEKIFQKGLQEKISMPGDIPYNNISSVYRGDNIFVLPSLRESGGSVLIEAMAHKLPIVALNMSMCSILNKKQCGLFVETHQSKEMILKEFAKKLTELIQNPHLRTLYGNNGYKFVNEELTWESMIKKVYGEFWNMDA